MGSGTWDRSGPGLCLAKDPGLDAGSAFEVPRQGSGPMLGMALALGSKLRLWMGLGGQHWPGLSHL